MLRLLLGGVVVIRGSGEVGRVNEEGLKDCAL